MCRGLLLLQITAIHHIYIVYFGTFHSDSEYRGGPFHGLARLEREFITVNTPNITAAMAARINSPTEHGGELGSLWNTLYLLVIPPIKLQ